MIGGVNQFQKSAHQQRLLVSYEALRKNSAEDLLDEEDSLLSAKPLKFMKLHFKKPKAFILLLKLLQIFFILKT